MTSELQPGDVAFLQVSDVTDIGAFVDWGKPKELLVPFAEQTRELAVGDREPIGVYVDNTGRFAGTMRIRELLAYGGHYATNQWLAGEAWRNEPVGLFVILERRFLGLLPADEPHALQRGQAASFRVTSVLPDGKVELSLRRPAYQQIEDDAACVLSKLAQPGTPKVSDHSSPEQIRQLFGLSKKAFKRAVGHLLKQGSAKLDASGFVVPRN